MAIGVETPKKLLRILCLHGYKQNAVAFRSKTAVLRKSLKDIAEFIYVDAPHMVDESKGSSSWWRASKDGKEYRGWEQTLDYLRNVFETQGPFDGVIGFSQGAVLASLICSISSLNNDNYNYNEDSNNSCFQIKFALLFSGFQSRATAHQSLYPQSSPPPSSSAISTTLKNGENSGCECCSVTQFEMEHTTTTPSSSSSSHQHQQQHSPPSPTSLSLTSSTSTTPTTSFYPLAKINTPSLHVWGKADELVAASNCESLSHQFSNPECYVHEFGHLIPTSKTDIQIYHNFLAKFLKDCGLE
ncbi:DUF341 family protein [Dictyostelium discoideum AX4]|uniref:DUF341 family protein n=1 Tax=Dictyostelium discoideum TaxID=44689 RepID=Q55D01_DICDI|nr:DUF341 family protein [Dictyostelium discoideum AX4]EAL72836.1 DUF341 family protein [Dictyostelium discoideum AX4]|eukprot:XP_646330.1 DUF341 family protein [Dictyostelium discoideum AX4]